MNFFFEALDRKGESVSDTIDAPSESHARQQIKSKGLYLVRIKRQEVIPGETASEEDKNPFRKIADKIEHIANIQSSKKQIGLFSRQLGTLLGAGLSLRVALNDIIEQIEHKHFKIIISDVRDKIEEGSSFSNALNRHRGIFSNMYINMVRVGENLGSLDTVIERLADIEEKQNILTSKVRSALWYPLFMFSFAVLIVIFLMVNVIPRIAEMFKEQKKDLPLPTEIVIAISGFLAKFWFLIPVLVIAGIYFFKRYTSEYNGRKRIDELKMKVPLFSGLYLKYMILRFTQNLGILLNNRVDIIRSFEIVQKIVGNVVIEEKIALATDKIKEGASVGHSLRQADFLPKLVLGMISAGESSDKLDEMLLNIGRVYEIELDNTITGLTSLIEPIIIVLMGLVIGLIVISVMLPIMNMNVLVQ